MKKHLYKNIFLIFLLTIMISGVNAEIDRFRVSRGESSVISQYGITWKFKDSVEYGRYLNGDYWVLGSVEIVEISPASVSVNGRIINGSMLNPKYGDIQGYDSGMDNNQYSAVNNVARPNNQNLSESNSLIISEGSLVSSISADASGVRPQLTDAAILTIVSEIPPEKSMRPPYSSDVKRHNWQESDIRWGELPKLNSSAINNIPSIATLESYIKRPWIDHGGGTWVGRYIHPANNMPDYGRDMAIRTGDVAVYLLLDYTQAEKEKLMIYFLQLGIDWYGVTSNASALNGGMGGLWWGGGGQGLGRKWPIMFAGLMLNDNEILAYTNASNFSIFQEEQQYFYVQQSDVDRLRYTADGRQRDPYTVDMIGLPEWGEQHMNTPSRDGSNWNAPYREINSATIIGHILAAHIMGAKNQWNHNAIFDYIDRWWNSPETSTKAYSNFISSMYEQYRGNYPPVWN